MKNSITAAFASIIIIATGALADSARKPAFSPLELEWQTVANKAVAVPDDPLGRPFNSFNPPSVNSAGFVVLRGRSRGPEPPASGIFARDMSRTGDGSLYWIASRAATVPSPNNTGASFNEFPSFPRSGLHDRIVATRGNSQPVWQYTAEEGEARTGTSGVYSAIDGVNLDTSFTQLGTVPGFEQYLVPGITQNAKFDQFPGSPSPTDEGFLLTKGNYIINGTRQTGIFFRNLLAGNTQVQLIANTETEIPGLTPQLSGLTFGSTAPPSAAKGMAVFVAYDKEDLPTYGGIYLVKIGPQPPLKTIFEIGADVPDVFGENFLRFGEGLSFDGRHIAFWGTWGSETRTLRLHCPIEGNKDRIEYCRNIDPDTNRDTEERWQEKQIPVNQGVFVTDTRNGKSWLIARTGNLFDDFTYWTYSGHAPGSAGGDGDAEVPRWRPATFIAISSMGGADFAAAFKARTGKPDPGTHLYSDFIDGIYLRRGPGQFQTTTVIDTTLPGSVLDSEAPSQSVISELGIERDGFRGTRLAIAATMSADKSYTNDESDTDDDGIWAGVYITKVPAAFGR